MPPARDDRLQCAKQPRPCGAQFPSVRNRQFRKQLFAASSDDELHLSPISAVARTPNPSGRFQTTAQLDRAVVANLQPLGQGADGRFLSERRSFDCQQRLVLLWLDPCRTRDALAEIQEAANLIAEVRQGLVVDRARGTLSHGISISYYDINRGAKRILHKTSSQIKRKRTVRGSRGGLGRRV
jgi:hypothetical protein